MLGTERVASHLTDVARFTGRPSRVLGADPSAGAMGICTTSVTGFDELGLFTHLNALTMVLSPSVVWMLTDCNACLAAELAKWCDRRDVFWHYCGAHGHFALARK